jgi:hypothetical protein
LGTFLLFFEEDDSIFKQVTQLFSCSRKRFSLSSPHKVDEGNGNELRERRKNLKGGIIWKRRQHGR